MAGEGEEKSETESVEIAHYLLCLTVIEIALNLQYDRRNGSGLFRSSYGDPDIIMYDLFSADKTLLIYHKYRLIESTDESLISLQRKQSEPKPLLRSREHKAARLGLLTSLQRPKPGLVSEMVVPIQDALEPPTAPYRFESAVKNFS